MATPTIEVLLAEMDARFRLDLTASRCSLLACSVRVEMYDGTSQTFTVEVNEDEIGAVHVRETSGALPSWCPDRHINHDGWFCLGLGEQEITNPRTSDESNRWWARLVGYLKLQVLAAETGLWEHAAWAHGDAARSQRLFEEEAAKHPPGLVAAVKGHLAVREGDLCPCGGGRRTKRCHLTAVRELERLLMAVHADETAFWCNKNERCCATMKSCPLRKTPVESPVL